MEAPGPSTIPTKPANYECLDGLRDRVAAAPRYGANGKYLILQAARLVQRQQVANKLLGPYLLLLLQELQAPPHNQQKLLKECAPLAKAAGAACLAQEEGLYKAETNAHEDPAPQPPYTSTDQHNVDELDEEQERHEPASAAAAAWNTQVVKDEQPLEQPLDAAGPLPMGVVTHRADASAGKCEVGTDIGPSARACDSGPVDPAGPETWMVDPDGVAAAVVDAGSTANATWGLQHEAKGSQCLDSCAGVEAGYKCSEAAGATEADEVDMGCQLQGDRQKPQPAGKRSKKGHRQGKGQKQVEPTATPALAAEGADSGWHLGSNVVADEGSRGSVEVQIHTFITSVLEPLLRAGVVGSKLAEKVAGKATSKVMQKHADAADAAFLVREYAAITKLVTDLLDHYQKLR
eukprot:gene8010-8208_t